MRDLALDPATGDLLLTNHAARLTVPGGESIRQRLMIRLRLWQGEYAPDLSVGVPYGQMLGTKDGIDLFARTLRQAAASCPGIASLESFRVDVDASRKATVALVARAITGEPVKLDDFVVTP